MDTPIFTQVWNDHFQRIDREMWQVLEAKRVPHPTRDGQAWADNRLKALQIQAEDLFLLDSGANA